MKKTALILIACVLLLPLSAYADEALYKAKCAMCHGADGKKLAKADLTSAAVQDKSDDDLTTFVATNPKHNFKSKGLNDDQIKGVVKFVRSLKK
jgi:mono/diheme cytochrome c family protein